MGTTRKAPSGPKHLRCVAHEAYPSAPAGWLCFADEAPTDDTILERMEWADAIEASRQAHRAAWAERLALAPTGAAIGRAAFSTTAPTYVPTDSTLRPMTAAERAESERAEAATAAHWRAAIVRDPRAYGMTRQEADRLAAYGEAEAA